MDLTTAVVSACATALVAIVALMQNSKCFDEIGKRIERVEKQLDVIQSDLKEFLRKLIATA